MIETTPFYTCKYDKAFKEIMMKKEKLEITKTLLNKHMSIEDIIDITGLTKEEIESYKII